MGFIKFSVFRFVSIVLFLLAVLALIAGLMAGNDQLVAIVIHATTAVVPGVYIVAGIGLFLVSLLFYGLSMRGSSPPATFTFSADKGPVTISLRAIEDYITKYLDEQRIASSIKTKVGTTKNRQSLVVRASISAWSEQNIKEVGDTVQREIANRLREGLGLDNLERVTVSVDKIVTSKSARTSLTRPPGDTAS
jgi:uncharacterized alkaline shock family protein YloU